MTGRAEGRTGGEACRAARNQPTRQDRARWYGALMLAANVMWVAASEPPPSASSAPAAPSITASAPVLSPKGGLGVTIAWSTGTVSSAEVWVAENAGPERLFASGASGTSTVGWIRPGSTYEFRLYGVGARRPLLASVVVHEPDAGLPTGPGASSPAPHSQPRLDATPNPVPAGAGHGITTIEWDVGTSADGRVEVSRNGETPVVFASGPRGAAPADWIDDGSRYDFTLYSEGVAVATVRVTREKARESRRLLVAGWLVAGCIVALLAYDVVRDWPRKRQR